MKLLLIGISAGTDSSQGKGQIVTNINACLAVQATIKSTLGPYGGDLLLVDANGRQTITNDGATVMKVRKPKFTLQSRVLIAHLLVTRHRTPRRSNPHRYRKIARCRSGRWHNIRRCVGRRDPEGDQGPCRTRSQLTDNYEGFTESLDHGCEQDQGDRCQHR